MENLVWDDKYNIGVEVVDKAHAKLFRIMRRLMDVSQSDQNNSATYKELIKYLEAYSMTHFAEEEAYMRSIRYKGYAAHKKTHDNFRAKSLVSLKKDLELSNYSQAAVERVVRVMSGWLTEHIMKEDQAIVGKTFATKDHDMSSQNAIISRSINRAAMEACQVEAKLVNTDYKGQNIGNGYYARQWYNTESGIRLQALLAVEETLIARGVSLIAEQKKRKAEMTNEAVLEVFHQLFEHMTKLFRAEMEPEFDSENLLDRDQFRADFMKGYPCRLMFSTKSGYFVFCYRSWRSKARKEGSGAEKKEGASGGEPKAS